MSKSSNVIHSFPLHVIPSNERTRMISLGALLTRRKAQSEERQLPVHDARQRASSVEGASPVFGLPINSPLTTSHNHMTFGSMSCTSIYFVCDPNNLTMRFFVRSCRNNTKNIIHTAVLRCVCQNSLKNTTPPPNGVKNTTPPKWRRNYICARFTITVVRTSPHSSAS